MNTVTISIRQRHASSIVGMDFCWRCRCVSCCLGNRNNANTLYKLLKTNISISLGALLRRFLEGELYTDSSMNERSARSYAEVKETEFVSTSNPRLSQEYLSFLLLFDILNRYVTTKKSTIALIKPPTRRSNLSNERGCKNDAPSEV